MLTKRNLVPYVDYLMTAPGQKSFAVTDPSHRAVLQDPEVGRLTGMDHGPAERRPWDEAAEERMRSACTGSHWRCSRSTRARRVYEKTGFVVEGVLRDALRCATTVPGWTRS